MTLPAGPPPTTMTSASFGPSNGDPASSAKMCSLYGDHPEPGQRPDLGIDHAGLIQQRSQFDRGCRPVGSKAVHRVRVRRFRVVRRLANQVAP